MILTEANAWQNTAFLQAGDTEFRTWIEWAVRGIEALAVIIVIITIVVATARFLLRKPPEYTFILYRYNLAQALLLVLEILIAADVVYTVVLSRTLESIAALGLLVVVRTFLSWTLVLDTENRWPWQPRQR